MNLFKSLMGRRHFLVAAGVTSTKAMAKRRITGIFDPALNTGVAAASERSVSTERKGALSNKSVIFYRRSG